MPAPPLDSFHQLLQAYQSGQIKQIVTCCYNVKADLNVSKDEQELNKITTINDTFPFTDGFLNTSHGDGYAYVSNLNVLTFGIRQYLLIK